MPSAEFVGFAFLAGAAACLNPCGFALLPGYLAYFVGRDDGSRAALAAGLRAGAGMAGGVLAVFAGVGGLVSAAGTALLRLLPVAAAVVGLGVAGTGLLLLARPSLAVGLSIPGLQTAAPEGRSGVGFLVFGVAYGTASLGCTLPLFLAVAAQALAAGGAAEALGVFVAYGLGMAAVLLGLSLAVAAGHRALFLRLRGWSRAVRTLGPLGMVAAGAYLVYYQFRLGGL
jgi:cytochrome c biogenesis protein CcdA